MRREGERQTEFRGEPRAKVARTEQVDRHVAIGLQVLDGAGIDDRIGHSRKIAAAQGDPRVCGLVERRAEHERREPEQHALERA